MSRRFSPRFRPPHPVAAAALLALLIPAVAWTATTKKVDPRVPPPPADAYDPIGGWYGETGEVNGQPSVDGTPGTPIPIGEEAGDPIPGANGGNPPAGGDTAAGDGTASLRTLRIAPNPASQVTRFEFALDREAEVTVEVFDLQGRRVATPLVGRQPAGPVRAGWNLRRDDGNRVDPGLYFARVRTPDRTLVRRVTVVGR